MSVSDAWLAKLGADFDPGTHSPKAPVRVHANVIDGLSGLNAFGGFIGSGHLRSMADLREVHAELPWYHEISNDREPAQVIEIFGSSGGAGLLLDPNDDLSGVFEPQAMLVNVQGPRDESLRTVSFPISTPGWRLPWQKRKNRDDAV